MKDLFDYLEDIGNSYVGSDDEYFYQMTDEEFAERIDIARDICKKIGL